MKGYGFTYRGKHSDEFGITAERTIRPISASLTAVTEQIANRKGVYYYRTDQGASIIKVQIVLQTDNLSTFRPDIRAIAAWLNPSQGVGPLVFDNEPDKTDEAIFYNDGGQQIDITQLVLLGRMELHFLVPDGESLGADHNQVINVPPATFTRSSVAYDDSGNQVAADVPRYKVVGKNLIDPSGSGILYRNNDGSLLVSNYGITVIGKTGELAGYLIPAKNATAYSFSASSAQSTGSRIIEFDTKPTDPSQTNVATHNDFSAPYTFTTSSTTSWIFVGVYASTSQLGQFWTNMQLEVGSTETQFEPMNQGVLVEEGTTNEVDTDFHNWSDTDTTRTFNADGTTTITNVNYNVPRVSSPNLPSGIIGKEVTFSVEVLEVSNGQGYSIAIYDTGGGNGYIGRGYFNDTGRKSVTVTIPSNAVNVQCWVLPDNTISTNSITVKEPQIEQKPYATTFIDGTRANESLTIPSNVLNVNEGTIEYQFYVDDVTEFLAHSRYILDANGGSDNVHRVLIYTTSHLMNFLVGDNNNSFSLTGFDITNVLQQGLNTAIARWDSGFIYFNLNGQKTSSPYNGYLPAFGSDVSIGCTQSGTSYFNGYTSKLRISSIARTDEELANQTWQPDEYTTAYMDFEGNIKVINDTNVVNVGTSEAYPVITVTFQVATSSFKITAPNGESIDFNTYDFKVGDVLVINCQYEKITINDVVTMSAYDWTSSGFFTLAAGDNDLVVIPNDVAIVTVDYQERWS